MKALILVDIQNDFLPGGPLAVPQGHQVVPVANDLMACFDLVVATQDWHPGGHESFAANHPGKKPGDVIDLHGLEQVLWPVHCVQDTEGAALASGLNAGGIHKVFRKGEDPEIDSYSGFFDNGHQRATGLADYLRAEGVDEVYVLGLATDYCVKHTALDGRQLGFKTCLVEDGCRGVDLSPGDAARAIDEMKQAGVVVTSGAEVRSAGNCLAE
jgi:nicotinamidase/pyrazinamidase